MRSLRRPRRFLPTEWQDIIPNSAVNLNHAQAINDNQTDFLLKKYQLMVSTFNSAKERLERIQELSNQIN